MSDAERPVHDADSKVLSRDLVDLQRGAPGDDGDMRARILRSIMDLVPGYLMVIDREYRLRFLNRYAPGYRAEEVLGQSFFDYVDPTSIDTSKECFDRVFATGVADKYSQTAEGAHGQPTPYETAVGPIYTGNEITGLTLLAMDISSRLRLEASQQESDEKLALTAAVTGMGLWSWDVGTDHVFWDKALCQIFGIESDRGPRTRDAYLALVHPDDRQRTAESIRRALETGTYEDLEHRIQRPDGEERQVFIRGKVVTNEAGETIKLLGGVIDITERKAREQQMHHAQRMEAIGQLTAGIAHHFNNLLAGIIPNLELANHHLPAEQRSGVSDALKATATATDMVRQLMTFASPSRQASLESISSLALVEQTADMCRWLFANELTIEVEGGNRASAIRADRSQLEHALLNVLLNARDAINRRGPVDPRITIRLTRLERTSAAAAKLQIHDGARDVLQLEIEDNGAGMTAETAARVFEPFFTTKDVGAGTGLGLATTYAIVREHGGSIECTSRPDQGTTFTLCLPLEEGHHTVADDAPGRSGTPPGRDGTGTVMIVDDERIVRDSVQHTLEWGGYRVCAADSGDAALELLRSGAADDVRLVLLDLSMPGMSGKRLLPELRHYLPQAKVILFTGFATPDGFPGVDRVLEKPASMDELLEAVRQSLGSDDG